MAEEFAERMLRTMNEASVALMVSVGHPRAVRCHGRDARGDSAEIAARRRWTNATSGNGWRP